MKSPVKCKAEAHGSDKSPLGSAGLTHLLSNHKVIAQGLSGADGAKQEDKDDVKKPPAKHPKAEYNCYHTSANSPTP